MNKEADEIAKELRTDIKISLNNFLYTQNTESNKEFLLADLKQTIKNCCRRNKLGAFESEVFSILLADLVTIN